MGTFSLLLSANYEIIILIEHTKFAFELFDSQIGNISTQVLPHNAFKFGWRKIWQKFPKLDRYEWTIISIFRKGKNLKFN